MSREDDVAEVLADWRMRREEGESIDAEAMIAAHPDLAEDLRAHFAAVQLLDFAVLERMDADRNWDAPDREGARIGPYEVLGLIGKGGMGRVYLAEQHEPIHRRVALKVLDGRVDNPKRRARFEVEREALALMDSPYIAPVYDAGVAADGTPYVAMAYVEGAPITDHCAAEGLGLAQRLELFAKVCDGVHHAHQKGVIHRDIKPTNVLVSGTPGQATPRVIDFGLAKGFDTVLGVESQLTIDDQVLGTPAYMSPEQAKGERDVDVRSDVYALGVLLYEMLTDDVPWGRESFTRRNLAASLRRILEQEPPRPSTHVSTIRRRRTQDETRERTPFTDRALKGDLDWIVLKALAKERERRYASAQDLADDVRRHLRNEPVEAGPPTVGYRLGKFVRRHKAGVVGGVLAVVSLVAGLVVSLQAYREAERARGVAVVAAQEATQAREASEERLVEKDRAARRAQTVSDLLLDVFRLARPGYRGADAKLIDVLDAAEQRLQASEGLHPESAATLHHVLGRTWLQLQLPSRAIAPLERAVAARVELLGRSHEETLEARLDLAVACLRSGDPDRAEKALAELRRDPRFVEVASWTARSVELDAEIAAARGDREEATRLWTEVVALRSAGTGSPRDLLSAQVALAHLLRQAEPPRWRLLVADFRDRAGMLPSKDPVALRALIEYGRFLLSQGEPDEAVRLFLGLLPRIQAAGGAKHPDARTALELQAQAWEAADQPERAAVAREALGRLQNVPRTPDEAQAKANPYVETQIRNPFPNTEPAAFLEVPSIRPLLDELWSQALTGDLAAARTTADSISNALETLIEQKPSVLHRRALARWLGGGHRWSPSPEEEARRQRRALDVLQRAAADAPNDLVVAREIASTRSELAVALGNAGHGEEGHRQQSTALRELRELSDRAPGDPAVWRWLAAVSGRLAKLSIGRARTQAERDEGIALAQESRAAAQRIRGVADYRGEARRLETRADLSAAAALRVSGRAPEGHLDPFDIHRRARDHWQAMLADEQCQDSDLAWGLVMYGEAAHEAALCAYLQRGELSRALQISTAASQAAERHAPRMTLLAALREEIRVMLRSQLVDVLSMLGDHERAAHHARELRELTALIHKRRPSAQTVRKHADALRASAMVAGNRGHKEEARAHATEAIPWIRKLASENRHTDEHDIADMQWLAARSWSNEDPGRTLALMEEVLRVREKHLAKAVAVSGPDRWSPDRFRMMLRLGAAHSTRGHALLALGRLDEAHAAYERQREIHAAVVKVAPRSWVASQNLSVAHEGLANVARARGKPAVARAHHRDRLNVRVRSAQHDWRGQGEAVLDSAVSLLDWCRWDRVPEEARKALKAAWGVWATVYPEATESDEGRLEKATELARDLAHFSVMLGHTDAADVLDPAIQMARTYAQALPADAAKEEKSERRQRLELLEGVQQALRRRAKGAEPVTAFDHLARAHAQRAAGEHERAVESFGKGLAAAGFDPYRRRYDLIAAAECAASTPTGAAQALAWLEEERRAWTTWIEEKEAKNPGSRVNYERTARRRETLGGNPAFRPLQERAEFHALLAK